MNPSQAVFRRALSKLLHEVFDGPPANEGYVLNPGDPGLMGQLDAVTAEAASARPMPGKTTIAAHVDHVRYGLSLLTRWAAGEATLTLGGDRHEVTAGAWVHMPAKLPHSVKARTPLTMLLLMLE